MRARWTLLTLGLLAGCYPFRARLVLSDASAEGSSSDAEAGAPMEASVEAGMDAPMDAGAEAEASAEPTPEAAVDAEAGFESGPESSVDAAPEATLDAAPEGSCGEAGAGPRVVRLSAGAVHTCALFDNGTVRCWGEDSASQLGDGLSGSETSRAMPQQVPMVNDAIALATGGEFTCVVRMDRTLRCWGQNLYAQAGQPAMAPSVVTAPSPVGGASDVRSLSSGQGSSCFVNGTNEARCWGHNDNATFGSSLVGDTTEMPVLVDAPGTLWRSISVGGRHACGVSTSGALRCWGYGAQGQLATSLDAGPFLTAPGPTVPMLTDPSSLAVGYDHSCAVTAAGTFCWGQNTYGQLGNGASGASSATPARVLRGDLVSVAAGGIGGSSDTDSEGFSCGLTGGGDVYCWGANFFGQLGAETPTSSSTPLLVPGVTGALQVTLGAYHACALRCDGSVWCWGSTALGMGGLSLSTRIQPPARVPGL